MAIVVEGVIFFLLSATSMPVGEIINRVGYENSSYFHKEFKRRYGMTPNRYRKGG